MSAPEAAAAPETDIPEPDRIAGFPHPRETAALFGHGDAEKALLAAFTAGRLHHAWLLSGAKGIGKATLAYRFARFLLEDPSPDAGGSQTLNVSPGSTAFRQIAHLAHPDLLVLRRPWQPQRKRLATAITVDEARRLRRFLGQTAAGRWRVAIVDAADEMNISAANAVLKSLEEPPPECVFLLISSAPGRLPVTIRSRCRRLRLSPLGDTDLRAAVDAGLAASGLEAVPADALERCLVMAQGSPGAALRAISDGGAEMYSQITGLLERLPDCDYARVHQLADTLTATGAESRFELFHDMLAGLIARLVAHAASGQGATGDEAALAAQLVDARNLARWAGLWETLQRAKADADALNLDRKTLILETFFQLEQVARRNRD